MANQRIEAELDIDVKKALRGVKDVKEAVASTGKEIQKAEKGGNKFTKVLSKGLGASKRAALGFGSALKKAGIGLIIVAMVKLGEVISKNQSAIDFFTTANNALTIAFTNLIKFISENASAAFDPIANFFSSEGTGGSIVTFTKYLASGVIVTFQRLVKLLGGLGKAVGHLFKREWAGATEAATDALSAFDGGVDQFAVDMEVVKTKLDKGIEVVKKYTKGVIKQAAEQTKLNKAVEIAAATNALLLQQYDKEAELQRQTRDDITKTAEERQIASDKLLIILDKQEIAMKANAEASMASAMANIAINDSDENRLALLQAKTEMADIEATITGLRTEQLMAENGLKTEAIELDRSEAEQSALLEQQKRADKMQSFDMMISLAGKETAIGKAIFLAKQGIVLKEQIMRAKDLIKDVLSSASVSAVDSVKGIGKATAALPPPANIPGIVMAVASAAMTAASMAKAVSGAKKMAGGAGGGGSVTTSIPKVPAAFNVVGTSGTNQLAESIAGERSVPIKAFVVSDEVSSAQSLDRNIIESASI